MSTSLVQVTLVGETTEVTVREGDGERRQMGEAQDGAQGTEAVHSVHGFGHFSQHGYLFVYFTS